MLKRNENKLLSILLVKLIISPLVIFILIICGCNSRIEHNKFPILSGPYLGQKPPGMEPELFAPDIISDGLDNRDIAIIPDGKEIYFTSAVGGTEYVAILCTKEKNGVWIKPEVAAFSSNPKYMYYEPCISFDGSKLFFTSNMPVDGDSLRNDPNIWYVKREYNSWSTPIPLDTTINSTNDEYFSSITEDGTLYFTRGSSTGVYSIYRSKFINGKFTETEKLPDNVNSGITRFNAYIARDESFLILSVYGLEETVGGMDYYIVKHYHDDSWGKPINLGNRINTEGNDEYSPYISPDGKYFFFMSKRSLDTVNVPDNLSSEFLKEIHNKPNNGLSDVYWVSTKIIDGLLSEEINNNQIK